MDNNISLNVTPKAKMKVLELGFDIKNGARPMARIIQDKIKVPLADLMLKTNKKLGNLKVDYCDKNNKFKLSYTNNQKKLISVYAEG